MRPRLSFWLGVILIVLSFGIYPAYPVVPFLPISRWARGGAAVGLSVVSWGMFLAGSTLAGKEGVAYLRGRLGARRAGSPRRAPGRRPGSG